MFGVEAGGVAAGLLGKLSVKPTAVRSLLGLGLVRVKAMVLLPLEDRIWFFVNSLLICGGRTTVSVSVAMPVDPLFMTVIALLLNEIGELILVLGPASESVTVMITVQVPLVTVEPETWGAGSVTTE